MPWNSALADVCSRILFSLLRSLLFQVDSLDPIVLGLAAVTYQGAE
jgi:hypothetical protein